MSAVLNTAKQRELACRINGALSNLTDTGQG